MSVVEAKVTDDATTRVAADLIDIRKGRAVYENRVRDRLLPSCIWGK